MKTFLRSSFLLLTLSAMLTVTASAKTADGYVDFNSFMPTKSGDVVEITIGSTLLKFGAIVAKFKEPAAAELLRSIQHVRINVVELDRSNRADAAAKLADVRRSLESKGWARTVTVREKGKKQHVDVYIKSNADDTIQGVVVTVMDQNKEAVFVNVVGNIKAEQIAQLCERFDVDALNDLDLKSS